MKTWRKASIMAAIAITIAVGTAIATTWPGSTGTDQMLLYDGADSIQFHDGDDFISFGNGTDCLNFYDGTADLIFHGPNADPANAVYMEYTEDDQDLTVYAATDFVVQLGN